jgi:hypothetical protein
MNGKKPYLTKHVLIVCSIAAVLIVLFILNPAAEKKQVEKADAFKQPKEMEVPIVFVRQDSVLQLLRYLAEKQGSSFWVDSGAPRAIAVHMERFGSIPAIFYCNNTALPEMHSEGFKLSVKEDEEKLDVVFRREKKGSTYYVAVPTDILCGLMKFHPKIR